MTLSSTFFPFSVLKKVNPRGRTRLFLKLSKIVLSWSKIIKCIYPGFCLYTLKMCFTCLSPCSLLTICHVCFQVLHTSAQRLWRPGEEILEEPDVCVAHLWCRRQWIHLWWGERNLFLIFAVILLTNRQTPA